MRHFQTACRLARKAWESADSARDPWTATLASHFAVHNSVIALRNLKTERRGKVGRHKREVSALARDLGFPAELIPLIEKVEAQYPESAYGRLPTEREAREARETARKVVAFLEAELRRKR